MKARFQLFAVSALLISVAAGVGAQTAPDKQPPLCNAMGAVCDTGNKTCENVQGVISTCQEAKASNDPKRMKAALDQANDQLTAVKTKVDKSTKIAEKLRIHMAKIEEQRARVKDEQSKLDALFYPTDEFIVGN